MIVSAILLTGCNAIGNSASTQTNTAITTAPDSVTWCITEPQTQEKCYAPVQFVSGETAYDTFNALQQREETVSFKATNYGDSGYFVDTVNGIAGDAKAFWKLAYNGEEAQVGISAIQVKNNDKLSFTYEAVK